MSDTLKTLLVTVIVSALVASTVVMMGGDKLPTVIERDFGGMDTISPATFHSSVKMKAPVVTIAATSVSATTTLSALDSGTVYSHSASGTTSILPAVANAGVYYTFTVGGALTTGNVIIQSAEGDNIEGSLIVAGAVVTCDAADQVNFVTDGENLGDNVTLLSDGTIWHVVDSNTLTAAKMTCTG